MKKKIKQRLVLIAALSIVITLVLVSVLFYQILKKQVVEELKSYSKALSFLSYEEIEKVQNQSIRVTMIREDGVVTFDNYASIDKMDNHKNRPEVIEAIKKGEGSSIRNSKTIGKSTFYFAVMLPDRTILRTAKDSGTLGKIFMSIVPFVVLLAMVLFLLSTFLTNLLTKEIIKPIERIAKDQNHMAQNDSYPELEPFFQTIRKQHEDILRSARVRQDFTTNVSHELKTPLSSISGYSELIENGMASQEDTLRFAKEINKNAQRLLALINDIIKLSQLDSDELEFELEEVDLYQLAKESIEHLKMSSQKQEVTIQLIGEHISIFANKTMIEEVLYNLIDNGIRYNNRGGSVQVTIKQLNPGTLLMVEDTGIGISKEHLGRIFERFYRVDKGRSKSGGGTGLGLAIVKHIVAKHQAKMDIYSEKGKGTCITIVFS